MAELTTKMGNMEALLVNQRQKSLQLESELSAAQDKIGGAKCRAQLLENENIKIKGELQSWNEWYEEDAGEQGHKIPVGPAAPNYVSVSIPDLVFSFSTPLTWEQSVGSNNIPMSMPMGIHAPTMAMSTPAVSTVILWDLDILMHMAMKFLILRSILGLDIHNHHRVAGFIWICIYGE